MSVPLARLAHAIVLAGSGCGFVLGVLGCGREIDSQPNEGSTTEAVAIGSSLVDTAGAAEGDRWRSHLYSERDADVFALLDEMGTGSTVSYVKAIHVEIGMPVRTGQVMARLEDGRASLAVEAARARADEAGARLARAETLLERELVPSADVETLRNALREATAELRQAQLDLARTRVRAPFGGVVARRYVQVGARVDDATPLFRVTAMTPLRVRILVPEREAAELAAGAALTLTGVDGTTARGRVVLLSPVIDPGSGTREVVVEVVDRGVLLPGAEVVVTPAASAPAAPATLPAGRAE